VEKPFQDYYSESTSHCYGCGRLNEDGLQIKSYWDGEESVAHFRPRPSHKAIPGYVYGGLIASLFDCHSTGTAAAAMYRDEGREMDTEPSFRFLTGSLHVDYLRPTPIDCILEVRGRVKEIKGRKVIITSSLYAKGVECARSEVVAIQVPDSYLEELSDQAEKSN